MEQEIQTHWSTSKKLKVSGLVLIGAPFAILLLAVILRLVDAWILSKPEYDYGIELYAMFGVFTVPVGFILLVIGFALSPKETVESKGKTDTTVRIILLLVITLFVLQALSKVFSSIQ